VVAQLLKRALVDRPVPAILSAIRPSQPFKCVGLSTLGLVNRDACCERVCSARHGVLATRHVLRGVDAVPVTYAVHGGGLVIPVDRVKAKRTTDLQRLANVAADPRCVLLVEFWDEDWTRLWWVRVHGRAEVLAPASLGPTIEALAARYPQYESPGAITKALCLWPERLSGWSAMPQDALMGSRRPEA